MKWKFANGRKWTWEQQRKKRGTSKSHIQQVRWERARWRVNRTELNTVWQSGRHRHTHTERGKKTIIKHNNNGWKSLEIMTEIYFKHFLPFSSTSTLVVTHWQHLVISRHFGALPFHILFFFVIRLLGGFLLCQSRSHNLLLRGKCFTVSVPCFACKL